MTICGTPNQWGLQLAINLFEQTGNHCPLLIDYYSYIFEVIKVTKTVLTHTKIMFTKLNISIELITDKGQLTPEEF